MQISLTLKCWHTVGSFYASEYTSRVFPTTAAMADRVPDDLNSWDWREILNEPVLQRTCQTRTRDAIVGKWRNIWMSRHRAELLEYGAQLIAQYNDTTATTAGGSSSRNSGGSSAATLAADDIITAEVDDLMDIEEGDAPVADVAATSHQQQQQQQQQQHWQRSSSAVSSTSRRHIAAVESATEQLRKACVSSAANGDTSAAAAGVGSATAGNGRSNSNGAVLREQYSTIAAAIADAAAVDISNSTTASATRRSNIRIGSSVAHDRSDTTPHLTAARLPNTDRSKRKQRFRTAISYRASAITSSSTCINKSQFSR
jgi:hypothetical protein